MKTIKLYLKKRILLSSAIIYWLLLQNIAVSQSNYILGGSNSDMLNLNTKVGVGTFPIAKFQVRVNGNYLSYPVFRTVLYPSIGDSIGFIDHLRYIGRQLYGIYESSPSGLLNYFQDPVQVCKIILSQGTSNNAKINLESGANYLDFNLAPSWPSQDPSTPLTVYPTGITVRSNLIYGFPVCRWRY